jgi:arylsulfatase A-like enzyme
MTGLGKQRWMLIISVGVLLATFGQIPKASHTVGATSRPNVLLIVTDDQRAGFSVMPKAREWLKRGGTNFTRAFVTTPLCCPSRTSIFTGRYTHNHHVFSNDGEGGNLVQQSTLQYYLQRAGYETAMYGKYLNRWDISQPPPFFDHFAMNTTSSVYDHGIWNVDGTVKTIAEYNTTYISDNAQRFLNHAGSKRPWFLYLALAAPHDPYVAEPKYRHARTPHWKGDPAVLETDRSDKPPFVQKQHAGLIYGQKIRRTQFRTLMSVDDMISKLAVTLRNLGEERNTLVIFISDNGLMRGEHGLVGKKVPYEQSIKVPFMARWPGHLEANATDDRLVANIDIAPTVLQAAGLIPNPAYPLDGRSILGTTSNRNRLLMEHFPGKIDPSGSTWENWASTRTKTYKYTEYYQPDGTTVKFREYYDLRRDPWELHNLLGDSHHSNDPDDVGAISEQLAQDRACIGTAGIGACP